jgi:hypothetical protein
VGAAGDTIGGGQAQESEKAIQPVIDRGSKWRHLPPDALKSACFGVFWAKFSVLKGFSALDKGTSVTDLTISMTLVTTLVTDLIALVTKVTNSMTLVTTLMTDLTTLVAEVTNSMTLVTTLVTDSTTLVAEVTTSMTLVTTLVTDLTNKVVKIRQLARRCRSCACVGRRNNPLRPGVIRIRLARNSK